MVDFNFLVITVDNRQILQLDLIWIIHREDIKSSLKIEKELYQRLI